ncbi:MAG: hydantoinase/oxoprolinase family protein [Candidatus Bathyarchaeia archaeon]
MGHTIKVLGLDIGGANTKSVAIKVEDETPKLIWNTSTYIPVWKVGRLQLASLLKSLRDQLSVSNHLDAIGATMTAELSDVYSTKREGVNHILSLLEETFKGSAVYVLTTDSRLVSLAEAREAPLKVASANWAATGWLACQLFKDCVAIDVGSTTTSIIPVSGGKVAAKGATDFEKLIYGELVYTGALRTNPAAIVNAVPFRGEMVRVSSELFTSTGDIHLVLGNIQPEDYTAETADGRGKSRSEAIARIARLVCADKEMLNESDILHIARYVEEKQILQIADGLGDVLKRTGLYRNAGLRVLVTGLGRNFLARKAAEKLGLTRIIDLGSLVGGEVAVVSTAFALALMTASMLVGGRLEWLRRF